MKFCEIEAAAKRKHKLLTSDGILFDKFPTQTFNIWKNVNWTRIMIFKQNKVIAITLKGG